MDKASKIAIIISAYDNFTAKVSRIMRFGTKEIESFVERANKAGDKALNFAKTAGGIGLASLGLVAAPLKAAADIEQMQVSLKTAFKGDEQAAQAAFNTISVFAAKTPYMLEEVLDSFIKLSNRGLTPSEQALESYGNTASAMGKPLKEMIEAVADATTGEFERLKEFAINASSNGKLVTFTFRGVHTTVRKNAADIEKYLMKIGNTHFAGGMLAQSKTIKGQLSSVQDGAIMTGAALGRTLIPMLDKLFKKVIPIVNKIQQWTEQHPVLAKYILLSVAAFGAFNLVVSAGAFIYGGTAKSIATLTTVFNVLRAGMTKALAQLSIMGRALLANPLFLAITVLAVAAFLVINNWKKVTGWFKNIISSIGNVISNGLTFAKNIFLNFTPVGLIFKHWDKIKEYFWKIIDHIKAPFVSIVNWIMGMGQKMWEAGKNIVDSIVKGIKSVIDNITAPIRWAMNKIRRFLPFSPAKEGPLMDLHKVKIIETIAATIKPAPVMNAMNNVAGQIMSKRAFIPAGGTGGLGGGIVLNFSPVINCTAGNGNIITELKKYEKDFLRMLDESLRKRNRVKFE